RVANVRTHASGRFPVGERLAEERAALRPLPPSRFDWSGHRTSRVPIDGYLRHGRCFYRTPERLGDERVELRLERHQVWVAHRGVEVARYRRSYEHGVWLPPPLLTRAARAGAGPAAADHRFSARARRLRGAVRVSPTKAKAGERLPYLLGKLKTPRVLQ